MDAPQTPNIEEFTDIDRVKFESAVVQAGRPIIMRGLVSDWPVVKAAQQSPEALRSYLNAGYNGQPVETFISASGNDGRHFYDDQMRGFNFQRQKAPLNALLDKLIEVADRPNPPAIYAGSVPVSSCLPGFAADNAMPLLANGIEPRVWIGNKSRVAAHIDVELNIACAIAGSRKFTVFPPDQVGNLYIGPLEFNMAGPPASLVDFADPDFERFPKFREAWDARIEIELQPGDALFLPPLWWHHVTADGAFNMLVNYWWPSDPRGVQMPAMALAMLAIRERPLSERQAWRSFFDHYVFGEGAAQSADHIPDHARGVLGQAGTERDKTIIGFVMRSLGMR